MERWKAAGNINSTKTKVTMFGRTHSKTRKATAIAAVALLAGGASVAATPASASGPSLHGCVYGAVCIYPGVGYNNDKPEPGGSYARYGYHNLSNQYGWHTIVNNQYGGAGYQLCLGYNGGGNCTVPVYTTGANNYNLTPYNSIVVLRPRPCPPNHCQP